MFSIVAMLTLALGIGANTAIFSVIEGILIKPLPYPHSESLVGVWHTAPGIVGLGDAIDCSATMYFTYREGDGRFRSSACGGTTAPASRESAIRSRCAR